MGASLGRLVMKKPPLWLFLWVLWLGCRSPAPISRPELPYFQGDQATSGESAGDFGRDAVAAEDERDQGGKPGEEGPQGEDFGLPDEETLGNVGEPLPRRCEVKLVFRPGTKVSTITVPGEWNGWDKSAHPMKDEDQDGLWEVTLGPGDVPPGEWGYKFLIDGTQWVFDPNNPLRKYVGQDFIENSRLVMPDCELPLLEIVEAKADWTSKSISVTVQVYTGVSGQMILPESLKVELQGAPLAGAHFDPETQRFSVSLGGLKPGKYSLLFRAANTHGEAVPLYVPLWLEEKPFSWKDAVLYFAMTDRFFNGNTTNDSPASCLPQGHKANWLGGDFAGIKQKIEGGYFDALGVNAIWISPANANPNGCYIGSLGYQYTAYHGYFPVSLTETDPHFGTLEELRELSQAAHARGIRILMDLAANHVHEDCPLWAQHKDWFNQTPIICSDDDNWNKHPIDCWFQPYLPDLDLRNIEALNAVTDAAIDWAIKADLDGFRVDAVKHMVQDFVRTLRYKVKHRLETTGVDFYLVGETFDGREKIKQYVSEIDLHGQFDFPLYWTILGAFARDQTGLCTVAQEYEASQVFYGADAIMSNFLGNHDVPRFISHAAGQIPSDNPNDPAVKLLAWQNPPELPTSEEPFRRLVMAFAFLFTLPGVPLIYYGDEIGMPGAGDPDNRRLMVFSGLTANQEWVKAQVSTLAHARAQHGAMRRGAFSRLLCEENALAYAVYSAGDLAVVALNRGPDRAFTLDLSGIALPKPTLKDVLTDETFSVASGNLQVSVPRLGVRVLVP